MIAECGELCRSRTKRAVRGRSAGSRPPPHIRHGKTDLTETLSPTAWRIQEVRTESGVPQADQQERSFPGSLLRGIVRAGTLLACRRSRSRLSHGSR